MKTLLLKTFSDNLFFWKKMASAFYGRVEWGGVGWMSYDVVCTTVKTIARLRGWHAKKS